MSLDPLALRLIWNNQEPITKGLGFRDLFINPESNFPFGRKGLALSEAWRMIGIPGKAVGMLLLDGDVAIDPCDNREMYSYIWSDPERVWVAPAKIWPVSHLADRWLWAHGKEGRFTQEDIDDPDMFSFCFTYLPASLITAAEASGLREWTYPEVDMMMWSTFQKIGVKISVARNCQPKHMHYML